MNFPEKQAVSLEEFYRMRETTDRILEYIDGIVLMSPYPSTHHQRISGRLHVKLFHFLEKKPCEVFHAPFDIELKSERIEGKKIVVPDLTVICDPSGLTDTKFVGVPTLIIEILSPSNQAYDLVFKLNLYMQYGVREYWIVNPMHRVVQIYSLNDDGQYEQAGVWKETGMACSRALDGFSVDVEPLFRP
ncbi:restriction endonuclease family protein [Geobacillus kaustophilus]|uniref:Restriction endonuclease family protein n=1 Tax=Geobacillus kaustophilus TaxID=1462 RepID=A0A0D8BU29_GEOKU|nr:Uma2 family endonuclease [Geobacillus kaustophilus]KJE27640.1 restriction endonuclease family protein [Geobacillus kaustophilus]